VSVVLGGRDLPAVSGSGPALAALDGAAIDHELGLGGDRVVMVNPSAPSERSFGRLAQEVFGLRPLVVLMLVYPMAAPSGRDLRRWCEGIADFGHATSGMPVAAGAVSPAWVRRKKVARRWRPAPSRCAVRRRSRPASS
jgi:hypothetical protein